MTKGVNAFNGEIKITLCDKAYPMRINLGVMAKFRSETGKDFNAFAARVMDAWRRTEGMEIISRSATMAEAVPMDLAAWAFYLAANEYSEAVTRAEIEDAVYREGVVPIIRNDKQENETYPILVAQLAVFALIGCRADKPLKETQKKSLEPSSSTSGKSNSTK